LTAVVFFVSALLLCADLTAEIPDKDVIQTLIELQRAGRVRDVDRFKRFVSDSVEVVQWTPFGRDSSVMEDEDFEILFDESQVLINAFTVQEDLASNIVSIKSLRTGDKIVRVKFSEKLLLDLGMGRYESSQPFLQVWDLTFGLERGAVKLKVITFVSEDYYNEVHAGIIKYLEEGTAANENEIIDKYNELVNKFLEGQTGERAQEKATYREEENPPPVLLPPQKVTQKIKDYRTLIKSAIEQQYPEMKEQDPRSVEVLCKLAEAYLKKYYETSKSDEKYLEESYKEALNARSIDPTSVLPHITIAKIFEAQGQSQIALTHAKKAVELEPGNPEAKQLLEQLETSPRPVTSPPAAKTQPTVKAKSTTSGGGVTVMPGSSTSNGLTILVVFLCVSSLVLVILILAVRRRKNVVREKICAGLDVLYSDGGRKSFSIQTSKTRIGRDPTNSLVVNDQDVSSFHAEIVVSKDSFLLKDLGSANGTYVNGKKISECYLYVGDEIILGTTKISLTN